MVYTNPVTPGHTGVGPAIIPGVAGVAGLTTTAKVCAVLVPHELIAATVMFPFCPAAPAVTVIDVVPAPEVIVHPVGNNQLYDVAFGTAATV